MDLVTELLPLVDRTLEAVILDVLHGSSPAAKEQSSLPSTGQFSPSELRVLRYLPTNLSRPEIAGELSVSPSTVSTHIQSIYAKARASSTAAGYGCSGASR